MSAPSNNDDQAVPSSRDSIFQSSSGPNNAILKSYNDTLLDAGQRNLSQAQTTLEVIKTRIFARHKSGEDYSTCLSRFIARAYGFEDLAAVSEARVTGWEDVPITFAAALTGQMDTVNPAYAIAKAAFDGVEAVVRVLAWSKDYATRRARARAYMQSWIKCDDRVSWVPTWSQPVIPSVETGSR